MDDLHAFHSESIEYKVSNLTHQINSVNFYDSIVVLEKKSRNKPEPLTTGNRSIPFLSAQYPKLSKFGL